MGWVMEEVLPSGARDRLGSNQPPIQWIGLLGVRPLGVKRSGYEANYLVQTIRMGDAIPLLPHVPLWCA